jgi:hypothetical protein
MKLGSSHVCIVQNGHYGDIIDLLPVAYHLHKEGKTVWWLCPEDHRDIFDFVSYVKPVDLPVKNLPFRQMIALANDRFEKVILGGIWDFTMQGEPRCQSYNVEHWRVAGYLAHFFDPDFRLVLDRWHLHPCDIDVPRIVCNVTDGNSSPFPFGSTLLRILQAAFPGQVLDIGPMRLPKFLDLLNIIAWADVLVSIDTGTLWLSEAIPSMPVVAIVSHAPWGGSVLRRPVNARVTYREVQMDAGAMIIPLEHILETKANPEWRTVKPPSKPGNWPEVFLRGNIDGESDIKLRLSAIKAWHEVLEGAEPPMFFDRVMKDIAARLGLETDDLIQFTGTRQANKVRKLFKVQQVAQAS